jgi:soluble lytic murein transglycosylase-like protein
MVALLVATTVSAYSAQAPVSPNALPKAPKAPLTTDELIHEASLNYGVSEALMRRIIACESTFNPNAIGDGGYSFGLVQIHLPSWRGTITKEQALDPVFAVDFLAQKLSTGQGRLWTCYRKIQGI